jgi:hypothetical protein
MTKTPTKTPKTPKYDPETTTLRAWLEETARAMRENPKQKAAIMKERTRVLRSETPTF